AKVEESMEPSVERVFEFGGFRLDPVERRLTRDGRPVDVRPKTFDILALLVERHGHLVRKDELLHDLWRDSFVEEGSLKREVSALRKALGENGSGEHYIETLPKAGYRFVAPVRVIERERAADAGTRAVPDIGQSSGVTPIVEQHSGSRSGPRWPSAPPIALGVA